MSHSPILDARKNKKIIAILCVYKNTISYSPLINLIIYYAIRFLCRTRKRETISNIPPTINTNCFEWNYSTFLSMTSVIFKSALLHQVEEINFLNPFNSGLFWQNNVHFSINILKIQRPISVNIFTQKRSFLFKSNQNNYP